MNHDGYKSRKLAVTIGHSILFTVMLWNGVLTEEVYQALEMVLVIFFVGGNVAEKFSG